jgi:histidinol-phosphate phosphatase family protein
MTNPPRAIFVDKDGTLVRDVPHNVDLTKVALTPGAGPALAQLRTAGFAIVLVTNQAGVARGLFSAATLEGVWRRIAELLSPYGAALDAIYYCPHDPAAGCRCRKPQPGLIWRAAVDHGFELARSWLIGDILDDVEAGNRAGCRTVLLDLGGETEWRPGPGRRPTCVVHSFAQAAQCILCGDARRRRSALRRFRSPPWMLGHA